MREAKKKTSPTFLGKMALFAACAFVLFVLVLAVVFVPDQVRPVAEPSRQITLLGDEAQVGAEAEGRSERQREQEFVEDPT